MGSRADFFKRALYHTLRRINEQENSPVHKVYRAALLAYRRLKSLVTRKPVAWVSVLQTARWLDDRHFEISGYAFERGIGFPDAPPVIAVWLQGPGSLRLPATVTLQRDMAASASTKDSDFDYSNTGFRAVFDLSSLFTRPDVRLRALVRVSGNGHSRKGGFRKRFGGGSARFPEARMVDTVQVVPGWAGKEGLVVDVRRPIARLVSLRTDGAAVQLEVAGAGLTAGELVNESGSTPLRVTASDGGIVRLSGQVPAAGTSGGEVPAEAGETEPTADGGGGGGAADPGEAAENDDADAVDGSRAASGTGALRHVLYRVQVNDSAGRSQAVATALPEAELDGGGELTGFAVDGDLVLRHTPVSLLAETVEFVGGDDPVVRVQGRVRGPADGIVLTFVGPHQTLPVELSVTGDRFHAVCRLMTSTWGRPPLSPKSDSYVLRGTTRGGESLWVGAAAALIETLSEELQHPLFRCRFLTDGGRRVIFRVKIPRGDDELGFYHQRMLEQEYRKATFEPQDSIFFESFYGRHAACNPRALDAVIAREHPEITRYWGVIDHSVGVPEGAIPVAYNTKAWWDARGRSRWVIANDWLRKKFKHQPHQVVLQTWHGSMFKRIGLDRPGFDKIMELALKRERNSWDLLLSQNRHSTDIFRSAYAWEGPILEEGYPRNDALVGGDGAPVRELLGIPQTDTVVLYAPTWRDDQEKAQLLLDLPALAAELGDGYTVLLRGHARTLGISEAVTSTRLIDVTTYPDITELFLASDVLITDYSSVMFDFSVTGRPMIFFVPDLDDYRDSIRGVYFDLEEVAPGPVLYRQELMAPAIRSAAADRTTLYADKYDAWQARFNEHDDGNASWRVMERLFATEPPRLKVKAAASGTKKGKKGKKKTA